MTTRCPKAYQTAEWRSERGRKAQAARKRFTTAERFWPKVDKSGDCWLWTGAKSAKGYGAFDKTRAHRVAYKLTRGPIPAGVLVLHRCDNPPCVNPDHLFLGTNKDNTADMAAKGRAKFRRLGKSNGAAKLTDEQVAAIRADTRSHQAVADAYAVSYGHVYKIRRGVYR